MKPLFKNTTKYNSKNYNEFINFHSKKFNFSYNAYTLIMCILLLYCIILNIFQKDIWLILLFSILFALMILFRLYLPMKRYQKNKKMYSKDKQLSITFTFYPFYFSIGKKFYPYMRLYKVFETKDYFYLYINEDVAALVSKTGFNLGTSDKFSEFIKKKCFFKYRKET